MRFSSAQLQAEETRRREEEHNAEMQQLRKQVGDDQLLVRGWLPQDDEQAMRERGLLPAAPASS